MIRKILPTATLILTLLALSLSAAPTWAGKFYKWVDAEGVTHYTLHPPTNTPAESLNIKTSKQSQPAEEDDTATAANTEEDVAEGDEEQAIDEKGALKPEELAKIKKEEKANCDKARQNLYTLKNRTRITTADEKTGGKRYLNDEERAKWTDDSEKVVNEFCK